MKQRGVASWLKYGGRFLLGIAVCLASQWAFREAERHRPILDSYAVGDVLCEGEVSLPFPSPMENAQSVVVYLPDSEGFTATLNAVHETCDSFFPKPYLAILWGDAIPENLGLEDLFGSVSASKDKYLGSPVSYFLVDGQYRILAKTADLTEFRQLIQQHQAP